MTAKFSPFVLYYSDPITDYLFVLWWLGFAVGALINGGY